MARKTLASALVFFMLLSIGLGLLVIYKYNNYVLYREAYLREQQPVASGGYLREGTEIKITASTTGEPKQVVGPGDVTLPDSGPLYGCVILQWVSDGISHVGIINEKDSPVAYAELLKDAGTVRRLERPIVLFDPRSLEWLAVKKVETASEK